MYTITPLNLRNRYYYCCLYLFLSSPVLQHRRRGYHFASSTQQSLRSALLRRRWNHQWRWLEEKERKGKRKRIESNVGSTATPLAQQRFAIGLTVNACIRIRACCRYRRLHVCVTHVPYGCKKCDANEEIVSHAYLVLTLWLNAQTIDIPSCCSRYTRVDRSGFKHLNMNVFFEIYYRCLLFLKPTRLHVISSHRLTYKWKRAIVLQAELGPPQFE